MYEQVDNFVKSLFGFTGRLNRKAFLLRWLVVLIFLPMCVFLITFLNKQLGVSEDFLLLLLAIVIILSVVASISLEVKRLHDLDRSGWFVLINLVPFISFIFTLYLIIYRGTVGPNKYGPDPLQPTNQN